ncbi:TRAP transporter small permease [Candidatus Sumerlaeota bacterium]|nr:TRAP transporter small permease [Candidatus Sumerlaeota bacterium]
MIRKIYHNFEEIIGSIFLVAICVVAAIQVSCRYLLAHPFSWTEELATYLFVYLTFIGASLALKKNEHFAVEIFKDRLSGKINRIVRISIVIFVFMATVVIFVFGCRMAIRGWRVHTPALEIPSTVPYAAVPLGGLLMMIRSLELFIRELKNCSGKE